MSEMSVCIDGMSISQRFKNFLPTSTHTSIPYQMPIKRYVHSYTVHTSKIYLTVFTAI